jgi:hypothetical protein
MSLAIVVTRQSEGRRKQRLAGGLSFDYADLSISTVAKKTIA